jgi:hypothetical protein
VKEVLDDAWGDKKIGAESSDPNRHSQPRLPGSVVGEASMPGPRFRCKITEVIVPKLLWECLSESLLRGYQRMRNRMHR